MDGIERLRGADPINDELEVGFDEPFEASWLRAELVGRIVDAELRLVMMPSSLGPNQLEARLDDHAPIKWTQFIVP